MAKVVDLGRTRRDQEADDSGDCRKWTVEDAVVDFLETLRGLPEDERPTQLVLLARLPETNDTGGHMDWERFAGVLRREIVAILEEAKFNVLIGDDG